MKDNNYKIYKQNLSKEDFFSKWDSEQYHSLSENLKERIYNKYIIKSKILNRDSFKCQNMECKTPDSPLTIHHIKHRRNNGEDKERNLITICRVCHKSFNRTKKPLVFSNEDNIPAHVRGHTFRLSVPEKKIDWKKITIEMKQLRKKLKYEGVVFKIKDMNLLIILMKFLSKPYYEFEGYDDDI